MSGLDGEPAEALTAASIARSAAEEHERLTRFADMMQATALFLQNQPRALDTAGLDELRRLFLVGKTACDRSTAAATPPRFVLDLDNGDGAAAWDNGLADVWPEGTRFDDVDAVETVLESVAPELCIIEFSPDEHSSLLDLILALGLLVGVYVHEARSAGRRLYFTEWRSLAAHFLRGLFLVADTQHTLNNSPSPTDQPDVDSSDHRAQP